MIVLDQWPEIDPMKYAPGLPWSGSTQIRCSIGSSFHVAALAGGAPATANARPTAAVAKYLNARMGFLSCTIE
ncbi:MULTISPECIES: hypothetical protein [unclassified Streptomyces]|uniref:hypothetical protein n=1 Tax=unclassified Streptomyces TaxID=2593676 RepID=UPI00168B666D|nr:MULTISPECIES: hypothetical protein [unclassified Streptomyces]MBD3005474.1 hypothetical protein [Streptomyces sp. 5-10]